MQTVQNHIRLQQKSMTIRFDRLMELFKITNDTDMKKWLQSLFTNQKPLYVETEKQLFGPVVDLTTDAPSTPAAGWSSERENKSYRNSTSLWLLLI